MSKNAFAQSLDKTATVIQHLVDERNKPGYDLLCKVFAVYPNVSKDWLLEGTGSMLKTAKEPAAPVGPAAAPTPIPATTASLFAAVEPKAAPEPPVASAPLVAVPAPPQPVAASVAAPAPVAEASPAPVPSVAPAAPDPAYFTAALQTQYLQHQLALAEQRNQHLLQQQALMQQLVAVLQGR